MNFLKVPYEVMALQVERMYAVSFPEGDFDAIEKHCNNIADFIESCGWTVEEYMDRFIREGLDKYFPDPKTQN